MQSYAINAVKYLIAIIRTRKKENKITFLIFYIPRKKGKLFQKILLKFITKITSR